MRLLYSIVLGVLCAVPAKAQSADFAKPARPSLVAGADTNDARAYASFANGAREPAAAYAGFFWAHHLRPTRVDYLAGMSDALLAGGSQVWNDRRRKDRREVASELGRRADSLSLIIAVRDPFFGLPPSRGTCQSGSMEVVKPEGLVQKGVSSLRMGCYYRAIAYLEEAARRDTMLEHALHSRAVAWHMVKKPSEAAADMQRAIIGVRRIQAQSIEESMYNTAMLEYMQGMMYASFGDALSARHAFERAIGEDLSFYMAHVRLAELAMGRGDLNGAIESLSLATQIRPDDALALAAYAQALVAAERYEEARAVYATAIEHAPAYADLRFALAELFDRAGDAPSALGAYREYVARAARHDSAQVAFATDRIGSLVSAKAP